jgi:two-component system, sensor histidine kinase
LGKEILPGSSPLSKSKLPWWTWVLPLLLFHLGTEISLLSKVTADSSLFYFPAPIAVILVYWWGPRVLPACYINATLSAGMWGLNRFELWPIYAAPEVIFAFLSWLFFIRLSKGKCWLPNIRHTILFLMFGVVVPLLIYKLVQGIIFIITGDSARETFWNILVTTTLGDFISLFGITIPILYFFSGPMARIGLANGTKNVASRLSPLVKRIKSRVKIIELFTLVCLLLFLSLNVAFSDYWFIYGSIALYTAIRWGMGTAVIINSYVLFITYLIPSILNPHFISLMVLNNEMVKIQLGSSILYVFSTITGRVISDVDIAKRKLNVKNKELEQINKELDRFVYSVSHDLSAPLKSIQGLVTISLMDKKNEHKEEYLLKVGQSASKLDFFIKEILDYSRNKRLGIHPEQIQLLQLCEEVIDGLKYIDHFQTMRFDLEEISSTLVYSDRLRLKIILNNLFSNAIKFQKRTPGQNPLLKVFLKNEKNSQKIIVRDNGEGIRTEYQSKIFEMFFRANENSNGSGLGLYIAKEAAEKIGGKLSVNSEYGQGCDFILEIPQERI